VARSAFAQRGLDQFGDHRDHTTKPGERSEGINDFEREELTGDAVNKKVDSEALALDAFPSESVGARAPWRSPEEVALRVQAPRAALFQQVDAHVYAGDDTAVSWDTAPVYLSSQADMGAADFSTVSPAALPVPPSRRPWLGILATTLVLLPAIILILVAIGVNLLPADEPGVDSAVSSEPVMREPAMPPLEPVSPGPGERTAGTTGVVPDPVERDAAREALPSAQHSVSVNDPRTALPPFKDRPAEAALTKPENALAPAVARSNRSDTNDVASPPVAPTTVAPRPVAPTTVAPPPVSPPPAAAAPALHDPAMSPPSPLAADTVAPADAPLASSRTDTPGVDPIAPDAIRPPSAPAIPPDATVDRTGTAAEATAIDGITAALGRLQLAYEQRDASLAKAVWPTVNERALARAFEGLRSQSITFDRCWMNVFSASADVECRGVTTYVPRVGSQSQRTESRQWTFRVQKGDDHWVITSAEAR
jgi:hypothetical protein